MSKKDKKKHDRESSVDSQPVRRFRPADILLRENRGILLDVFVFLVSIFLMRELMGRFVAVARAASAGDKFAVASIFLYFASFLFLAPIGAVLKRWPFHERIREEKGAVIEPNGCLFSPIIYYCVLVIIFSIANAILFQYFFGDDRDVPGWFILSIFLLMVITGVHTWLVYRYFSPGDPPRSAFMQSRAAEGIGDACIFVNMIFFQILWNILAASLPRPMRLGDIFGNLGLVAFGALFIYFPGRVLYLAEDIHRKRTWLFILLANLPVLYNAVFGSSHRPHLF